MIEWLFRARIEGRQLAAGEEVVDFIFNGKQVRECFRSGIAERENSFALGGVDLALSPPCFIGF